jgi:hypothetical protein
MFRFKHIALLWFVFVCSSKLVFGQQAETVFLLYDPIAGGLQLSSQVERFLTSIELRSKAGVFTGQRPSVLDDSFGIDTYEAHRLFMFRSTGFTDVDFGPSVRLGMTQPELADDLCFQGTTLTNAGTAQLVQRVFLDGTLPVPNCFPPLEPLPVSLQYDPSNGEVSVDVIGTDNVPTIESMEIRSRSGIFGQGPATNLDG